MGKASSIACTFVWLIASNVQAQQDVKIEPAVSRATSGMQQQAADGAIRNYLEAWHSLRSAFEQNRSDLLDRDFVGSARKKLGETIQQQGTLGLRTIYQDKSHDIQIVFYSPEGLSIELTDNVDYDMHIQDKNAGMTRHLRARYVVVMTPAEVRWRVRVFEAGTE